MSEKECMLLSAETRTGLRMTVCKHHYILHGSLYIYSSLICWPGALPLLIRGEESEVSIICAKTHLFGCQRQRGAWY